jgi:uncharacterized membrane protein
LSLPPCRDSSNGRGSRLGKFVRLGFAHHTDLYIQRTIGLGILGWEQRFCTRCSGQWFGAVVCVAASLVARLEITLVVWSVAVALLPLPALIDWVTQTWGIRESGTLLRLVTGGLLGIGIGLEIVSAAQLEWGRFLVGFVVFCGYVVTIYMLFRIRPARPYYLYDLLDEAARTLK